MPIWSATAPTLSRLVGSGCLSCPDGSRVAPDDGLMALETLAKNIMVLKRPEFEGPTYPLQELPTKATTSPLLGGDDYAVDYSYHIPKLHEIGMHNPNPNRTKNSKFMNAGQNCGVETLESNGFDVSSIACNPPRGVTGVMGKDISPIQSWMAPLEMGPFCTAGYQNFDHLVQSFAAMEREYPKAAMNIVNYHKIREFINSNQNLAAATAGSRTARFSQYQFVDRPNSVGSIEWFMDALDRIASYSSSRDNWRVSMSRRLFTRWMRDYARANNVVLNLDFASMNQQVGSYLFQASSPNEISLITIRLNTKFTITFDRDPIYVIDQEVDEGAYEWNFQPWFVSRPGDDTRSGESAGFVREKNPDYGAACADCPDGMNSLSELILIYNDEYLQYEAFPKSPFAGVGLEHLSTDLQALWGSMEMKYYFGSDVDVHFFQPMLAATGRCPSNIDNTWFAGRMNFAFRQRILRKRAAGALLVKVPQMEYTLETAGGCLTEERPEPIVLSAREPQYGARECVVASEEDIVDPVGELRPACSAEITATDAVQVIEIEVERRDGLSGPLSLAYTMTEGTATAPEHYTTASGNLNFLEGQTRRVLNVAIAAQDCVAAEDAGTKRFTINWTGAGLGDAVCETTVIDIHDNVCDEEAGS